MDGQEQAQAPKRQRLDGETADARQASLEAPGGGAAVAGAAPATAGSGQAQQASAVGPGPLVLVWDLDETLLIFNSLVSGSWAAVHQQQGPAATAAAAELAALGARWEAAILRLCDEHFFFDQLEEYDQTCLEDIQRYDDGASLAGYNWKADGFPPPRRQVEQQPPPHSPKQHASAAHPAPYAAALAAAAGDGGSGGASRGGGTAGSGSATASTTHEADAGAAAVAAWAGGNTDGSVPRLGNAAAVKQQQQQQQPAPSPPPPPPLPPPVQPLPLSPGSSSLPSASSTLQWPLASPDGAAFTRLDGASLARLAYRYRRIHKLFSFGTQALGTAAQRQEWEALFTETDGVTGGWLSHASTLLADCSAALPGHAGGGGGAGGSREVVHVAVTSSQLIPSLAKLLLFRLHKHIKPEHVWSSRRLGKQRCFEHVRRRFGGHCAYVAIGDGIEEDEAAAALGWPYIRVLLAPGERYPAERVLSWRPDAATGGPGLPLTQLTVQHIARAAELAGVQGGGGAGSGGEAATEQAAHGSGQAAPSS